MIGGDEGALFRFGVGKWRCAHDWILSP